MRAMRESSNLALIPAKAGTQGTGLCSVNCDVKGAVARPESVTLGPRLGGDERI
jgi:hypothetical protein